MTTARKKQIFLSALDLASPTERDAYLAHECGDDCTLRQSVEELLAAHDRMTNILDYPLGASAELRNYFDNAATQLDGAAQKVIADANVDRVGELVGNFRLLEKIGEGGFGQVYVAQQEQPVRRRVAASP